MKKLLITLLLISPFSFADWGDVYYCQETNSSGITVEGKKENYILEKFQFKLDKTKKAMVFGKDGFFSNSEIEVVEGRAWPAQEMWYANTDYSLLYFDKGTVLYVATGPTGINSISADCDKF